MGGLCFVTRQARGLALVAVLWMVAALSLAVTGILYAARIEVRTVASFKEVSQAIAAGDAAIRLAARELAVSLVRSPVLREYETEFEGRLITVRVIPLAGLIDLNAAPESLLADLIAVAGGVERTRAEVLAQRIVDWRDPDDVARPLGAEDNAYAAASSRFRTRGASFEASSDLLQVLGFDFELHARVEKLVTVDLPLATGRVNPAAAPWPVLNVLARGDTSLVDQFVAARRERGALADATRFPSAHVDQSSPSRFRVDALVPLSSGALLVRQSVIDLSGVPPGAAWNVLRADNFVAASDEFR